MSFENTFLSSLFARRGGIKLGLNRIEEAYSQIKEKDLTVYHVAGTNGKGTTVYAIAHLLQSQGYKTGMFISPHIVDYNERISINNQLITDAELQKLYDYLEKNVSNFDDLSFFEITFLMAWKYFERSNVDRVVFEVGLGGRLDASNVIAHPKIDVITSIGLEHTRVLGDTVEEIALEKLGIVSDGDTLFIGADIEDKLAAFIRQNALAQGAEDVGICNKHTTIKPPRNTWLSKEQYNNLRLAQTVVEKGEYVKIKPDFSTLHLPGRYELIDDLIIVDVAHNPPAIESLVQHVAENEESVIILYSALRDKNIAQVMDLFNKIADRIFLIYLDNCSDRAADIGDMYERTPEKLREKLTFTDHNDETIQKAVQYAKDKNKKLLVTGSFFTIEKFLKWYNR